MEHTFKELANEAHFSTAAISAIFKVTKDTARNWRSGRTKTPDHVLEATQDYLSFLKRMECGKRPKRQLHILEPSINEFYYEMQSVGVRLAGYSDYRKITDSLLCDKSLTIYEIVSVALMESNIKILPIYNKLELHACLARYGFLNTQRQSLVDTISKIKQTTKTEKGSWSIGFIKNYLKKNTSKNKQCH